MNSLHASSAGSSISQSSRTAVLGSLRLSLMNCMERLTELRDEWLETVFTVYLRSDASGEHFIFFERSGSGTERPSLLQFHSDGNTMERRV